jgi:non-ribosomal peptide synthetase component F
LRVPTATAYATGSILSCSYTCCTGSYTTHSLRLRCAAAAATVTPPPFHLLSIQTITGHVQAPFDHITMGLPDHNVHSYVVVVDEEASPTDETHRAPPKARLAAIGEPGELWLSGPRLARGYRNRPDLTAKAFVPNPFFAAATATLPADGGDLLRPHYRLAYRTGDLVAMSKDGTIDFLGRVDRQVKVNGVRMEVGEIENVLSAAPGEARGFDCRVEGYNCGFAGLQVGGRGEGNCV